MYKFISSVFLLVCILLLTTEDAHAYLDPGKGSHLFQVIVSGLLAIGYTVKKWFRKKNKN